VSVAASKGHPETLKRFSQSNKQMPEQSEHDEPQNLVEESTELEREAARSLQDAADSHNTLQGFFAINNERPPETASPGADEDARDAENREKGHPVP
jgi:hypothetical protein